MPPVGFEPTISAGERPQTYALDRGATGTGLALLTPTTLRVRRKSVCISVVVNRSLLALRSFTELKTEFFIVLEY